MFARAALIAFASTALVGARPAMPLTLTVPLSADAEPTDLQVIGLAGDADGSGVVKLTVNPRSRQICYDFTVAGVATPLMAHIHKGSEHNIGPSVVTLFTGPGDLHDCLTWTEKWVNEIFANPSNFYVNLYTTEFPDGALRGQLLG